MKRTVSGYEIRWTNKFGEQKIYAYTERQAKSWMESLSFFNPSMEETTFETYITPDMKKEFQKLIKEIREKDFGVDPSRRDNCKYPKPMMTEVQMGKGQATVNCGAGWYLNITTKEYARKIIENPSFKAFLEKYEATATIEYMKTADGYQVRLQF